MRQTRWPLGLAALIAVAVSAIMLSPFMNLLHLGSALHTGDGRLLAWAAAWVAHAITTGQAVFDANMFYPIATSLAQTDHYIGLGILGMPMWLATGNAVLTFNVLQLLGPAVSAFAAFLLFRRWTGDWLASMIGGLLFGPSSFALLHNAHLGLTWAAGIPLAILLFDRWWRQPTWGPLAGVWVVCMLTALMSGYTAAILSIVLIVHVAVLMIETRRIDIANHVPQGIAALMLGLAVLVPVAAPYVGRLSVPGETAAYAADLWSFVVPSEHTVVGRWLVGRGWSDPQGFWGERTLFLGWVTIALAALGLVEGLRAEATERRLQTGLLIALLMIGAALSFGPSPTGLAPFDLLAHLPGFNGLRATARFALLVAFAVSGLAVFGLTRVRRIVPGAATVLLIALACVMLAERFVVDFPAGRPTPETMPEVYAMARADGARAAVALPMYAQQPGWFFETDYLLYSTAADFLPLANGYGRWPPSEYLAIAEAMRDFPSPASAAALRFYGITHVILHSSRFSHAGTDVQAKARQSLHFQVVAEQGPDMLLRVASN